jgi:hypothetical protein
MRQIRILLLTVSVLVVPLGKAQDEKLTFPARILIIRHAEKPDGDSVDLSDQGKKRAEALPGLFKKSETRPEPFPTPDFIFATKDSNDSHRPLETVTPLAKKLGLTVNTEYRDKETSKLADEIFHNPKYAGKTVLICWHHGQMPALAMALQATTGVPEKVKATVFDRVWVLTYDQGKATFVDRPQQLLAGDMDK